ncbi:hypothetical protein [Rickettsiella massiliensis]|uniref:hypothetical protein n=1 Tax=Rickettsiella massiliensis TaxID=676517 RepID=UPI0012EA5FF3|nr:hypothetical protein [Rickettsiella massiliensis]
MSHFSQRRPRLIQTQRICVTHINIESYPNNRTAMTMRFGLQFNEYPGYFG